MSILKVESIREPYNNTEAMFIDSSGDVTFSGSVVIPGTISGVNLSTLNTTVSTLATDLTSLNSTVSTLSTDLTSLNSTVGNIVGLPDAIDVDVSAPADSVNIDSSGNLFVGTTSIGGVGSPKAVIKQSTTNWYEGLVISASSNDNILTLGHTGTEAQIGASYGTSGSYTPLTFKTSNTERMRIDSSGNVGIGTSSPSTKLDILSTTTISGTDVYDEILRLDNAGSRGAGSGIGMSFYQDTNERCRISAEFDVSGQGLHFYTRKDGQSLKERLIINGSGQVGIGELAPSSSISPDTTNLRVGGLTFVRGTTGTSGKHNSQVGLQYNAYPTTGSADNAIVSNSSGDFLPAKYAMIYGSHYFYNATSATADSNISWTERMRIDSSGRVTMPYQPAFHANGLGNSSTGVQVYGNVEFNVGGHYNSSNGRFTAPVDGTYMFGVQSIANNSSGVYRFYIKVNGSSVGSKDDFHLRFDNVSGHYGLNATFSFPWILSSGDYVEVNCTQQATTLHGDSTEDYPRFWGYLLG